MSLYFRFIIRDLIHRPEKALEIKFGKIWDEGKTETSSGGNLFIFSFDYFRFKVYYKEHKLTNMVSMITFWHLTGILSVFKWQLWNYYEIVSL